MPRVTAHPWQFLVLLVAGWVNRHQLEVIDYLREENRVLREQLGSRRPRFTVDQRRRLAAKGMTLGRRLPPSEAGNIPAESSLLASLELRHRPGSPSLLLTATWS
jgi:hypothetical protein